MFWPFFRVAMLAPARQLSFRVVAVAHALACAGLATAAAHHPTADTLTVVGYVLLGLALVEGAAVVGWRLTQMPKSQSLEFLLSSPVQPKRLFAAEALVGVARFALVWLGGLPLLGALAFCGVLAPADLWPVAAMPFVWGLVAGFGLTAWVYEPPAVRRVGELLGLVAVLVYLVVGVVAAENLRLWLELLPPTLGAAVFHGVKGLHDLNPFGLVRYWFDPDRADVVAWRRFDALLLVALTLGTLAALRGACRLSGHFHDRHYRPIQSGRASQLESIADRPLSWWAVRRVMEYSGKVNLWLAGGFCLVYAAYIAAGDAWPPWMGRLVFELFETWGGPPTVATALGVMAAVPAAFQFGLWDATVSARCQRLELLLLTGLEGADYWHASLSASWRRGRGYFVGPVALWLALGYSGRVPWPAVAASACGAATLWWVSFAVGFRAFATGRQTSGLASVMTLGLPLALAWCLQSGHAGLAYLIPAGQTHLPLVRGVSPLWCASCLGYAAAAALLTRYGLRHCDANLRTWYDANQGLKAAG